MKFADFLKKITQDSLLTSGVWYLKTDQAPVLFLHYVRMVLTKQSVNWISVAGTVDSSSLQGQLSMSFLGQSMVYCLTDSSLFDAPGRKKMASFLQEYQGPHVVMVTQSCIELKCFDERAIEIPERLSMEDYACLYHFLHGVSAQKEALSSLFAQTPVLSLDGACVIAAYHVVLGRSGDVFCTSWLPRIVVPEKSLFTLSQYFFARQAHSFFSLWYKIKDDYPPEFWLVYWSDQIWQAYIFLDLEQSEQAQAKKLGLRLPFSFFNKDWRLHTKKELMKTHAFLYDVDYAIKHANSEVGLDLFVAKFVHKEFM